MPNRLRRKHAVSAIDLAEVVAKLEAPSRTASVIDAGCTDLSAIPAQWRAYRGRVSRWPRWRVEVDASVVLCRSISARGEPVERTHDGTVGGTHRGAPLYRAQLARSPSTHRLRGRRRGIHSWRVDEDRACRV